MDCVTEGGSSGAVRNSVVKFSCSVIMDLPALEEEDMPKNVIPDSRDLE
jgi:hypothetical protein